MEMSVDGRTAPRLTIAIPTINRAQLLGRAIESALAQTSPDVETIVSDNGSTDETPAVIERYAGRGLRTFRHPSTMSAAKHGHFLMEQARASAAGTRRRRRKPQFCDCVYRQQGPARR
jgi:cellulose synthase/poly-beta-1,6-N-acetylglucosamine synthase-like glycosyltransferase